MRIVVLFLGCCVWSLASFAAVQLEIPRFASFKNDEVNMRTGPGERFPIDWVYQEKNYPVEVIDEFEFWRQIRAFDGTTGWVHRAMLSGARYALVLDEANLYAKPTPSGKVVGMIEASALGKIVRCPKKSDFCLLDFGVVKGWMERHNFWGLYPKETID